MKGCAVAAFLSMLLMTPGQSNLTPPPLDSSATEKVETGQLQDQEGGRPAIAWRIRLLPVASFPDLPPAVAGQLGLRQCMIPQSYEARGPENVIHGAFRGAGAEDWAALCSVRGVTTLYVFFGEQSDAPVALRTQRDTEWLGAEPGSTIFGSAWGIALSRESELRASPQMRRVLHVDHDGIDDAHLERSSTVRYYQDGHWLSIPEASQ
jgi:hypothetical protein